MRLLPAAFGALYIGTTTGANRFTLNPLLPIRFPVQRFASDNAPERRALTGEPVPLRARRVTGEQVGHEPLPISLAAHHVFCPHRAWLEAMGEKTGTHQMAVGLHEHHASDHPAASRGDRMRSVDIASQNPRRNRRCDAVEFDDAGAATVIE